MKTIKTSMIGVAMILLLASAICVKQETKRSEPKSNGTGKGFAVLELFTSEGCSSCPPADELLERIQKEAGNKPVYVLAYHVDYWDRLGWKDAFSNAVFSKRQYWYNSKFTTQVYTPQLILNGQNEFVGSDEQQIRNTISKALEGTRDTSLTLRADQGTGQLQVSYRVTKHQGDQLLIALVEKQAVSQVKAGENEGRTLRHAQIVHSLSTYKIPANGQGTEKLALPKNYDKKNWEVIAFIQNPKNGEILSADRATIN